MKCRKSQTPENAVQGPDSSINDCFQFASDYRHIADFVARQVVLLSLTLYKAVASILTLKDTVTETGSGRYFATIDELNFVSYLFIVCMYIIILCVGVSVCYGESAAVF